MKWVEANFDGLVGPTHNYGGLSHGNLASSNNAASVSRPREAALQGLAKAKRLADRGLVQGVLPPHVRPFVPGLRAFGFRGTDAEVIRAAAAEEPRFLQAMCSSAQMWAANAGTVSPAPDCMDRRLHVTPANLQTMAHRAVEAVQTTSSLRCLFADEAHFFVHDPLTAHALTSDEGAANFMRIAADHGSPGVEVFVWGRDGYRPEETKFPARQTLQTGQAIARHHGLHPKRTVHVQQSPIAIEAGAFHNDVVAVANGPVVFHHEHAFADTRATYGAIRDAADGLLEPVFIEVPEAEVPLVDAITSYVFNTQLITLPGQDRMLLLAPEESRETPSVRAYLERLVLGNGPIGEVDFVDVRQSMRNGGGPACLRLRVVLSEAQIEALGGRFLLDDGLYQDLGNWITEYYREELAPADLADPSLFDESNTALKALTGIMDLGDGTILGL